MISGNIQDIPLRGMTSTLSDYDCQDGDLMICHNMVNNGAGLQPVEEPVEITDEDGNGLPELPDNSQLVFTHKTSKQTVYIIYNSDDKCYMYPSLGSDEWVKIDGSVSEGQLSAVGNILIIAHPESGLNYYKWDLTLEPDAYKYLGNSFPDIDIKFSSAQPTESDTVTLDKLTGDDTFIYNTSRRRALFASRLYKADSGSAMTYTKEEIWTEHVVDDAIFATFNHVQSAMFKQGYFIAPILVRFAYKLYDGNYVMQSSPVMVVPSNNEFDMTVDIAYNKDTIKADDDESTIEVGASVYAFCMFRPEKLTYIARGISELSDWKDIIQEVSIFITPPVSKYLSTGDIEHTAVYTGDNVKAWSRTINFQSPSQTAADTFNLSAFQSYAYVTSLPEKPGEMKDLVESAAQGFYLLKSFSIEDLAAETSGTLKPKDNYDISTLATSEALTDGYKVRSLYSPKFLAAYNNRLNMAGLSINERDSFPDCFLGDYQLGTQQLTAKVYICEEGVWSEVVCQDGAYLWCASAYRAGFFYYPNPNAKYLYLSDVGYIKLTLHPYLNGAYYLNTSLIGYEGTTTKPSEIPDGLSGVGTVEHPNWVMTSEVDNPFLFPAIGVNAVGSGDILGLASATKAMSEGTAFGSHPLYVFTTEGIYPMAVGTTGIFVAVSQPVSREVPYSGKAILQIDNSVIFLCERGLMQLDGGRTTLLSGDLQSRYSAITASLDLEKWTEIHKVFFGSAGHTYLEACQFLSYIPDASLAFDYANYRIYVYNPSHSSGAAFVYNIGTKTWSTVDSSMQSSVVGYPSTLINLVRDNKIVVCKFTHNSEATSLVSDGNGFYVTRPMKFKMQDILKTVRRVIQRGVMKAGNSKIVALFGSRNLENYELIGAKKGYYIPRISGTPYDAFVVAGWIQLDENMNSVSRISLEVKEKYVDKLR